MISIVTKLITSIKAVACKFRRQSVVGPGIVNPKLVVVTTEAEQLALSVQKGDVAVRYDLDRSWVNTTGNNGTMADWQEVKTPNQVDPSGVVECGDRVVDDITKFSGIVIHIVTHHGNARKAFVISETIGASGLAVGDMFDTGTLKIIAKDVITTRAVKYDGDVRHEVLPQPTIELGDEVDDTLTPFSGTVVVRSRSINGHTEYGVQSPKLKEDGTPSDVVWLPASRLNKVTKVEMTIDDNTSHPRSILVTVSSKKA